MSTESETRTAVFSLQIETFVGELDTAIEAHLDWSRRVLRCAVLHETPAADVLGTDAHRLCRFGKWFGAHRDSFDALDADATARIFDTHERMHDAVRALCSAIVTTGSGAATDLDTFERSQASLVSDLARLKTSLLARCARHDSLTGLPLRYGLEEEYQRCRASAHRLHVELALVLIDVDHFKRVNDIHGHGVGDRALQHVADILRRQARTGEPVFRFGGEEFLLLLHAENSEAAAIAAERILAAVRDTPLILEDRTVLALSVSAGLVEVGADESMANAISRADQAMYAAKRAGRDRWRWAVPQSMAMP
jgi:diguanylate cyclase